MNLKELLKEKLTKEELRIAKTSFDIVGDIAVLEIPEELEKKEKTIAEAVMQVHKNVVVVAKKVGPTAGVERIRPVEVVLGENRTETIHLENNCKFKVDLNKVYFSPRLCSERLRVTEIAGTNEKIFDLFAGVGPFAIPLAKKGNEVIAIDINADAIEYLKENAKLNKVEKNITSFVGDAQKIVNENKWSNQADRIIMNLPMSSEEYLDTAFDLGKPGTVVHFYCFIDEENLYTEGVDKIKEAAEKNNCFVEILNKKKCGQLAPRVWRVAIDFKIV